MTKLNLYMRSGNVIRLPNIVDWKATATGNRITHLSIETSGDPKGEKLAVNSIDLSQIEAMTWE